MEFQEQIIKATQEASNALIRWVRAMPEDRLTWKPLDEGRTALDMVQECATMVARLAQVIETGAFPEFNPEIFARMRAERALLSLDDCEKLLKENNEKLFAAIRASSEEHLQEIVTLPWGAERTIADVAMMHYWNQTYHLGQIGYIQSLYGDREMYPLD